MSVFAVTAAYYDLFRPGIPKEVADVMATQET